MQQTHLTVRMLGVVFFMMIGLHCSMVYAADPMPPGTILPVFKLNGPDSPQTKAYLGLKDEKPFSLAQVKTKFMIVEFFDVF